MAGKISGGYDRLFQGVFHKPSQFIAGIYGNVQDLKNTYDENERLRKNLMDKLSMRRNFKN